MKNVKVKSKVKYALVCVLIVSLLTGMISGCGGKDYINLSEYELTVGIGDEYEIAAAATGGKTITWSSSDQSIATVNSNGVVKALAAGVVTITATAGSATFAYTSTGLSACGVQLVYRDTAVVIKDHYYYLDCDIEIDVDCVITVNGNEVELKAGKNDVNVPFYCDDDGHIYPQGDYTNPSSALFILMGTYASGEDDEDTMVSAAEITISNLKWTEYTPSKLDAPTVAISEDKVVTITDNNEEADKEKVGGYQLGLFDAEDNLVWAVNIKNGDTIDDSKCPDGTYTVKTKAIADDVTVANSDWAAQEALGEYTVAHGAIVYDVEYKEAAETDAVANPYTWYYWSEGYTEGAENNPVVKYNDGTLSVGIKDNSGNWYGKQLFYKNLTLTQGNMYTLTMKIESDVAGTVTINGNKVTLKVGSNDITINYTEGSGASFGMQFGTYDSGIDIEACNLTISNIAWSDYVAPVEPTPEA